MLRTSIDFFTKVLGQIKSNQKVKTLPDPIDGLVKVNLGCGLRVAKGWLNIDGSFNALIASKYYFINQFFYRISGSKKYYSCEDYCNVLKENVFLFHDLSRSLPLLENSVDFFYSSHFFEHLFKDDAERLLSYCYRALKPGGIIRISVPDLTYAISLYSLGKKNEMLDDYFFVEGRGSYLARHKYMYDFELIQEILKKTGFNNVTRCDFHQGKTPDIHKLDVYPSISLFVEAQREGE